MTIFCYQHHINNWRTKTAGLSLEEKGAYREMMDWFYALEGRLPSDPEKIYRILGVQTQSERTAIAVILQKFWICTDDGFLTQPMAAEELKKIKMKSKKAAESAASRYNNDLSHANAPANDLLTKNQEPLLNIEGKEPDGFDEFWEMYPRQRRGSKDKAVVAYKNALKRARKEEINAGCRGYITSDEVARGFAKGAAAWLNDDRWTTQYRAAGLGSDAAPRGSGKIGQSYGRPEPRDITGAALRVAARYSQEK